jgi:hypothetical protein
MKSNFQAFQIALRRHEELQQKTKTLGEGENLANELATLLASLLTQQKQQKAKVLLKTKILLISDEITQGLAIDSPLWFFCKKI